MCCAAAGAEARGVWLLQAGVGRRRQQQEQRRQPQQQQLGGGGDGGNGSVGDHGATGGSVQGRGRGVPLREEADSPLHRRHPHGERVGLAAPLAAVSLLPLPQAVRCALEKECVATPRRGLFSGRPRKLAFAVGRSVTSAGPLALRSHFEPLSLSYPSFLNRFSFTLSL